MNTQELVKGFIGFVNSEGPEDFEQLGTWLDRLAANLELIVFEFDDSTFPDAPQLDYDELRNRVSSRFPSLGFYNTTTPNSEKLGDGDVSVGDAVDDVTDILSDLTDVEWYFEQTSAANALWHFENSYWTHWARHLRDLQSHILNETRGI